MAIWSIDSDAAKAGSVAASGTAVGPRLVDCTAVGGEVVESSVGVVGLQARLAASASNKRSGIVTPARWRSREVIMLAPPCLVARHRSFRTAQLAMSTIHITIPR
jgi:hypothetical protein